MELLVALIVGGLAGWVASLILKKDGELGVVGNVVAGIIGAVGFNLLIAPLLGVRADITELSLVGFLCAVVGAVLAILIWSAIRKRA